jgi:hypothetical protein
MIELRSELLAPTSSFAADNVKFSICCGPAHRHAGRLMVAIAGDLGLKKVG